MSACSHLRQSELRWCPNDILDCPLEPFIRLDIVLSPLSTIALLLGLVLSIVELHDGSIIGVLAVFADRPGLRLGSALGGALGGAFRPIVLVVGRC